MIMVFLQRHREARKLPPSPRWCPSQGSPRKGQAPSQVTSWIALGLPHAQVDLQCAFQQDSLRLLPVVSTIRLSSKTLWALFSPYTVAATPQTLLVWSRKTTSLTEYKNGGRKHLRSRSMQTSLNNRPKPRASTCEQGLTNLSALQSTYTNH
jgi:hypothetical protein